MTQTEIRQTTLPGVVILIPPRFGDARGYFEESYNKKRLAELGIDLDFVQDNRSVSQTVGTIRGLHYQSPPHAQDKLVRCGQGALLDIAVDARVGSPTYGHWVGVELTPENGKQLLVPKGFLHGFVTRQPNTEVIYKCSAYYAPECDGAVRWDSVGIDWGLAGLEPVLSEKDTTAPALADFASPFIYEPSK